MCWYDTGIKHRCICASIHLESKAAANAFAVGSSGKTVQALTENMTAYQEAISERMGAFVRNLSTAIAGFVIGMCIQRHLCVTMLDMLMYVMMQPSSKDGK
jgi:hypothetical protein